MKKNLLLFGIILISLVSFGQYTENKLPSGLTISTTAADDDYMILQKNGETTVKAMRMDTIKSYMVTAMTADIPSLDSVSGQTGQFIISDGSGWLAPISAKYEGNDAFTLGYRTGVVGYASMCLGGSNFFRNSATEQHSASLGFGNVSTGLASMAWGAFNDALNQYSTSFGFATTASGDYSTAFGNQTTASGIGSTAWGLSSVASGVYSFAQGNSSVASGINAVAFSGGVASCDNSTAWNLGTASGSNSTAWTLGTASGEYSTAWALGTASGDNSTAWNNGTASGGNSTAWALGTASGDYSTAWNYGNAQSYLETSFGQFCDTAATKTTNLWVATDRLLTIGNGILGSPSNALVMLKNGNTTATGNWTIEGDLEVTGNVDFSSSLPTVSAYIPEDSVLVTTLVSGVPKFLGDGSTNKFVNTNTTDFALDGDTLYFDGQEPATIYISWGATAVTSTVSTTVHVYIYINDVINEQFTGAAYCKTAGEEYSMSGGSGLVLLSPDDTIKIYIEANNNCDVTNDHFPVTAFKVK